MNESCHTYRCVMTPMWTSLVADMNKSCLSLFYWSCHIQECDTEIMWIVLDDNKSCHMNAWGMAHIEMSRVTYMNEMYHIYDFVMSRERMSHGTHMDESCDVYEFELPHVWIVHMCDMTHSYAEIRRCTGRPTYDWFMCDMTHSCQSFMCDMTHLYAHSCVRHDSSIRREAEGDLDVFEQLVQDICVHPGETCHTYKLLMSHLWMSHVTLMNELCHLYALAMSHIWTTVMLHTWMSHVTCTNGRCQV